MQTKKQKISKLFYNKWPFKIECFIKGGNNVKYAGAARVRLWANLDEESRGIGIYDRSVNEIDKFDLLRFTNSVEPFMEMKDSVQIRVEGAHFNLFCKDIDIKDSICHDLNPWIREVYGPETQEELDFLLDQNHKVVCEKLPYGKFKIKVLLKDWIKKPEVKQHINNYLKKLDPESIKISPDTIRWLEGKLNYKQDPFFYLVDDKDLTFLRLITTDIKRVYEYVERDSINTSLQ